MGTAAKHTPNFEVVPDIRRLAERSVDVFIADARQAIAARSMFCVAISGGNTPKVFFELLGESGSVRALEWNKIQVFWVDERCVPPDSKWSNYKLASDTFLSRVPIPPDNIHRIHAEASDFEAAARNYEQAIRDVFGYGAEGNPAFDLVVLGMGSDGHTGSLFPNSYACFDTKHLACVVYGLGERLNRITLTHPALCAASHILVLVSGREKADIVREVFTTEPDEVRYPIHRLWPVLNKVTWLVDEEAAENIAFR